MECVICTETINDEVYSLECNHKFHTKCIIDWFRYCGTCPICRSAPKFRTSDILIRSKILRKISFRKDAPRSLIKLVEKMKKVEAQVKELKSAQSAHRNLHKEIFKSHNKLKEKLCNARVKENKLKKELGMYTDHKLKLPILVEKTSDI